jgi:iron(III) transport system substrate-binding protein
MGLGSMYPTGRWIVGLFATLMLAISGCDRPKPSEVVLYSSVDSDVLTEVIAAYERSSGTKVLLVGDTEATKTTGLVQRLTLEADAPRADVWWSSEAMGTQELADRGLLKPMAANVTSAIGSRDATLIAKNHTWVGFAARARVIAFNTKVFAADKAPRTLSDLASEKFRGRVGMARPQFGTTRTQIAALIAANGEPAARALLTSLKANDIRMYDGNSSVVRAIAEGEIDIGLTDTDDVWAAQANGWPVGLVFEASRPATGSQAASIGPLLIPNTVALVAKGPHPREAEDFVTYLLSDEVERILARSRSRNVPTRSELIAEFPELAVPNPSTVSTEAIFSASEAADALIREVFPLGQ